MPSDPFIKVMIYALSSFVLAVINWISKGVIKKYLGNTQLKFIRIGLNTSFIQLERKNEQCSKFNSNFISNILRNQ